MDFQDQLSLHTGQKYCRMLQGEHSAILSTFIKLPFVIKIFVFSIFEWPLKTGFTVSITFLNIVVISCQQIKAPLTHTLVDSVVCTLKTLTLILSDC